jgi:hypothetical protein
MLRWSGPAAAIVPLLFTFAGFPAAPAAAAQATHRHEAKITGGTVYVDGVERWRGQALTSGLAWSERHDALAFAGRDRDGDTRLVVLIVDDDLEPAAFSWAVPEAARPARAVTWLGDGRVGVGPSELGPAMVAEYTLAR